MVFLSWLFGLSQKPQGCQHDWETLASHTRYEIELCEHKSSPQVSAPPRPGQGTFELLVRKICLKCGERVDEITEYKKELASENDRREYRREKARKMWGEEQV